MDQRKAFQFRCPTRLLIAGPSGCGKTTFTTRLLLDNTELFSQTTESIHYCYGSWQKGFEKLKKGGVKFHEGIPDTDLLHKWFPGGQGILVLDDLMDEGSNDKRVLDLFTRDSYHQGVTVLYLCQDLFPNGKYARTISRNAHYIAVFCVTSWGCGTCCYNRSPTQWQDVLETYRKATERPFGYMLLDLHPASQDDTRVLSHVLKDEGFMRCYQFRPSC